MSKPSITLVDVYNRKLDDFNLYVLGKKFTTGVDQRREVLFTTARVFDNALKADQIVANQVLRHFLNNITDNLGQYDLEKILRPLSTMKVKDLPKDINVARMTSFIRFFIRLGENIHHIERFLNGCDLPYFFKSWPVEQRVLLLNFFCDIKS